MASVGEEPGAAPPQVELIVVGDLHGQIGKLERLWEHLETVLGADRFAVAHVVFLGDYVDRGPNPRAVLDWLCAVPQRYPRQQHVFLAGNHDFAAAAFLGVLPVPLTGEAEATATLSDYTPKKGEPPLWDGPGAAEMHLHGRRWGAGGDCSVFCSATTFASYGAPAGDRAALLAAMPPEHLAFLRSLRWAWRGAVTGVADGARVDVVAAHAGLEAAEPAAPQLELASSRVAAWSWFEVLQGRAGVEPPHPELPATVVVSGHHGYLHLAERRIICDSCGGNSMRPLSAVVLRGAEPAHWLVVTDVESDAELEEQYRIAHCDSHPAR